MVHPPPQQVATLLWKYRIGTDLNCLCLILLMFLECFSSHITEWKRSTKHCSWNITTKFWKYFLFTVRSIVSYMAYNMPKDTTDASVRIGSIFFAEAHLCFFLMSVKIFTCSAPICLRYLSRSPAQPLSKPSSATWENTKPSARMKSRPITMTGAFSSLARNRKPNTAARKSNKNKKHSSC